MIGQKMTKIVENNSVLSNFIGSSITVFIYTVPNMSFNWCLADDDQPGSFSWDV